MLLILIHSLTKKKYKKILNWKSEKHALKLCTARANNNTTQYEYDPNPNAQNIHLNESVKEHKTLSFMVERASATKSIILM